MQELIQALQNQRNFFANEAAQAVAEMLVAHKRIKELEDELAKAEKAMKAASELIELTPPFPEAEPKAE